MSTLLQSVRDTLWPIQGNGAFTRAAASEKALRLLAILLIALVAGPDVLVATDMTVLLELLGATMFFMAFIVGGRMVLSDLWERIRTARPSTECLALVRAGHPLAAPIAVLFLLAVGRKLDLLATVTVLAFLVIAGFMRLAA